MSIAFVIVCFLPQIPLRAANHPVLDETGMAIEDEFAQSDSDRQPRKQTARNDRTAS